MGCGQGCYPGSVYPAQWKPYNTGMLLAEPHPRENTECLSYSHTEHVAECCCAECHPWPGWASWELQGMFGSRWGSPSSYLAAGHPWNPSAFPWSCGLTSVPPRAAWSHLLHPKPGQGALWISVAQHPGVLSVTPVHAQIPQPLLALCSLSCWFLGSDIPSLPHARTCVRAPGKTGCAMQHSALLKSLFSAASLAALPPNYPFSIGFYNRNLYARPRGASTGFYVKRSKQSNWHCRESACLPRMAPQVL